MLFPSGGTYAGKVRGYTGMNHTEVKRKQITLLTYTVGMAVIIFFAGKLGDNGVTYLAAALETYLLLLALTAACVPDALSRLVRSRMAKGQYKNADRMLRGAFAFALVSGSIGGLLLWFLSDLWMGRVIMVPYGAMALKLLAPAYVLNSMALVLQGYFQGMGTAMPTVVSQIAKQVFILSFGLILCFSLTGYGEKVAALLQNDAFRSMYAGAGIAGAISIAGVLVLLFLLFVYMGAGRRSRRQASKEGMRMTEDSPQAVRILVLTMLPPLVCGFLSRLPVLLGLVLYQRGSSDIYTAAHRYGAFYGKYLLPAWIAVAIVLIGILPLQNTIAVWVKREDHRLARDAFAAGMQWVIIVSGFFSSIGIVLMEYLIPVLYGKDTGMAGDVWKLGGIGILFMAAGVYLAGILLNMDKTKTVIINLCVMLFVFGLTGMFALKFTKGDIMSLVYAKLASDLIFFLLNAATAYRALKCGVDLIRTLAFPVLACAVTGLITLFLSKVLVPVAGNLLGFLVCFAVGMIAYILLLLVFRCIKGKDMHYMPGGKMLERIGILLHLL